MVRWATVTKHFSRPAVLLLAVFALSNLAVMFMPIMTERAMAASSYTYFDASLSDSTACTTAGGSWIRREGAGAGAGDCQMSSTPADNITQFMWAAWFAECFRKRAADKGFNSTEISEVDFDYRTDMNHGYAGDGDSDGKYECQSPTVQSALSSLGFNQGFLAFLDYMGCTKSDGGTGRECGNLVVGTDGKNIMNKMLAYRYGSSPTMDNATKYQFYLESFVKGCSATQVTSPTAEQKNDADSTANSSKYAWVTIYNPTTNKMERVVFAIGNDLDKGRSIEPTMNELLRPTLSTTAGSVNITCRTLANKTGQSDLANAYLLWASNHKAQAGTEASNLTKGLAGGAGSGEKTCGIDGIGWLLCPVVKILASISDSAKGQLDKLLLIDTTQLFKTTDTAGTAYSYWKVMRNYANVAFVILFLFILYSQITSVGITNYGIKKLLPKMIIVALLVNVSFFICALAVDVSNFLGAAAFNFISGAGGASVPVSKPNGFADLAGKALLPVIGVVIAYFALASIIGMLIFVTIASVTVLFILGIRQALVILLVVLSPLAFVAMLLPNTEGLFKKWWGLFKSMLLLYPIIGLLYGAGKLASDILNGSSGGASSDPVVMLQIVAAFLLFAPLIFVYMILKSALAGLGAVNGFINKAQSGAQGKTNKLAQERVDRSRYGQKKEYKAKQANIRRAKIMGGSYSGSNKNPMNWGRNARSAVNSARNSSRVSGGFGDQLGSTGASVAEKEWQEQISQASDAQKSLTVAEIATRAASGRGAGGKRLSEAEHAAAIKKTFESGGFSQRKDVVQSSSGMSEKLRQTLVEGLYSKGDQNIYGVGIGDKIKSGAITGEDALRAEVQDNIAQGHVQASHMVHSESATEFMIDTARGEQTARDATTGATLIDPATGRPIKTAYAGSVAANAGAVGMLRDQAAAATTNASTAAAASGAEFQNQFSRVP